MPEINFLEKIKLNLLSSYKTETLSQIEDWILPHWYERQNNSLKPSFMIGDNRFINLSCRSWITLRPLKSRETVQIDRYGVIYLPKFRISIELWIQLDEKLYTPVNFPSIIQKISENEFAVETNYQLPGFEITTLLKPWVEYGRISYFLQPGKCRSGFKIATVSFVIRPYDNDGLSSIRSLEYKDNCLKINNRTALEFEKEPNFCYFTNEENGDVSRFFKVGEGNNSINSAKGLATGLIGYIGLPAELTKIRIFIGGKNQWYSGSNLIGILKEGLLPSWKEDEKLQLQIKTGTKLDKVLAANLNYFQGFTSSLPKTVNHIRVLNCYFNKTVSCYYLKECLRRIHWDGSLPEKLISPEELIWAIGDHYKIFRDTDFLEKIWPVLKRMGEGLWYQKGLDFFNEKQKRILQAKSDYYKKYFWICAALKSMVELAQSLGRINEGEIFKEQYLRLWSGITSSLSQTGKFHGSKIIPLNPRGGRGAKIVGNLAVSYPLRLWERDNPFIVASIEHLLNNHLSWGGLYSPLEFQGIDLALTAQFGEILLREGYDCTSLLDFLLSTAGETWNWPDRISPLTFEGIGKNGHDPQVTYGVLLFIRDLFVIEEENCLNLLPGTLNYDFWSQGALEIDNLPTHFGNISLKYQTIGNLIQLDYLPVYHHRPAKIRITLPENLKPVYSDAKCEIRDMTMELEPDFRSLRLKRITTQCVAKNNLL